MRINGFGIENFRSFDEEGVFLDDLNKINIIIGKNNSGKSNVLRFLQLLNSNLKELNKFPSNLENQHRRNGVPTTMTIKVKGSFLMESIQILNVRRLGFDYDAFKNEYHIIKYSLNSQTIQTLEKIENLENYQLLPLQSQYSSADSETLIKIINKSWALKIKILIQKTFADVIYIPHLRVIQEGHVFGESNSAINGSNIISTMFQMQNPRMGEEQSKAKFELIQSFVRELINKPKLQIEIPHDKEMILLTIDGNRLPLQSFGTGIHQLVILCSTLVIHENSIVCIEEPEIHLHPELQRKFILFLAKTKNTYFITTHSNVFLDSQFDTSIYHVKNDGRSASLVRSNRTQETFDILNDMGYRSSDILQSNGIIWVEGPSDRTYLLTWLKIIDKTLVEGLHFSIMFYGGRLLSHLSFEMDEVISDLIPLLKLNRNAFVLMDRDGFSSKTKLNSTKRRIKDEIGERKSWVTKGREIENYLTPKAVMKWLEVDKVILEANVKFEESIAEKSYATNKTKYSLEISKHIEDEDMDILDLRKKVNALVKEIWHWNI